MKIYNPVSFIIAICETVMLIILFVSPKRFFGQRLYGKLVRDGTLARFTLGWRLLYVGLVLGFFSMALFPVEQILYPAVLVFIVLLVAMGFWNKKYLGYITLEGYNRSAPEDDFRSPF